jgi:glycosyltransferase involved in cell wall biosynthesis
MTAGARNVGILASTGKYITFHDDDDVRLPGSLDRQVAMLEAHPQAGLCYGQVLFDMQDGRPADHVEPTECPAGDIFWNLLHYCCVQCITAVFRRSYLFSVGLLNPALRGFDDWDLWVRLCEISPAVVAPGPLAIYRYPTPLSDQGTSRFDLLILRAARHFEQWLRLPRAVRASKRQRREARQRFRNHFSDWLIWDGAAWGRRGDHLYCFRYVLAALRLNPIRATRPWTLWLLLRSLLGCAKNLIRMPKQLKGEGTACQPSASLYPRTTGRP